MGCQNHSNAPLCLRLSPPLGALRLSLPLASRSESCKVWQQAATPKIPDVDALDWTKQEDAQDLDLSVRDQQRLADVIALVGGVRPQAVHVMSRHGLVCGSTSGGCQVAVRCASPFLPATSPLASCPTAPKSTPHHLAQTNLAVVHRVLDQVKLGMFCKVFLTDWSHLLVALWPRLLP